MGDIFLIACEDGDFDQVKECLLDPTDNYYVDSEPFIAACCNGHVEIVKLLLESDRQINIHIDYEEAFIGSCRNGHSDVVNLLLSLDGDRYIDVHSNKELAFISACCYGHLEIVNLLLSLKGERYIDVHVNDEFVFRNACEKGNINVVKLLLSLTEDRRIDVNRCNEHTFKEACRSGNIGIVKLLLGLAHASNFNETKLTAETPNSISSLLSQNQLKDTEDIYLSRIINVHSSNEKAFRNACQNGHIEVVKLLLSLTNDRYVNVHCFNDEAFISACSGGHLEVVELLLSLTGERYIDVHSNNEQAFISACCNGHLKIVKLLLSLIGERYINVHSNYEEAFISACRNGHLEIVKLLLSLKGDRYVDIHINQDQAFREVCEYGHKHVLITLNHNRIICSGLLNIRWHHYSYEKELVSQYDNNNSYIRTIKYLLKLSSNYKSASELSDRKINIHALHFNDERKYLLYIMIRTIYRRRKKILIIGETKKNKRLLLRELKSLPKSHLYSNFPGGYDYLKMLSKY